jgi:hypothetical protein
VAGASDEGEHRAHGPRVERSERRVVAAKRMNRQNATYADKRMGGIVLCYSLSGAPKSKLGACVLTVLHGQPKTYPSALYPPEGVHGPGLDR